MDAAAEAPVGTGVELLIDAFGCARAALQSVGVLSAIVARLVADLKLHAVAPAQWHSFDGGGVTGLVLLSESHVACHSFPERGFIAFNLYCCRRRPDWTWNAQLRDALGATRVVVREVVRG